MLTAVAQHNLFKLFIAFFRANILSYGGGPASIPLMRTEIVDNFNFLTLDQFSDALAIGNALPGPIAPKMAAYVGYNISGFWGATVSVLASVLPTAILIIILANFLFTYKDSPRLISMLKVAKPIVVVLLLTTSFDMMTKSNFPNISIYVLAAAALVAISFFKINSAIVIFTALVLGFAFPVLF